MPCYPSRERTPGCRHTRIDQAHDRRCSSGLGVHRRSVSSLLRSRAAAERSNGSDSKVPIPELQWLTYRTRFRSSYAPKRFAYGPEPVAGAMISCGGNEHAREKAVTYVLLRAGGVICVQFSAVNPPTRLDGRRCVYRRIVHSRPHRRPFVAGRPRTVVALAHIWQTALTAS